MENQIITVGVSGFCVPAYRNPHYELGERWGDDYTGPNPAAHGCVVVTEEESGEGRRRLVAVNQHHREVGPWGPTRDQRVAAAKREAATRLAASEAEEDKAAKSLGVSVVSYSDDTVVCRLAGGGQRKTVRLSAIRAAAHDPWHPRLTAAQALAQEAPQERITRLAYRSLLRQAQALKRENNS